MFVCLYLCLWCLSSVWIKMIVDHVDFVGWRCLYVFVVAGSCLRIVVRSLSIVLWWGCGGGGGGGGVLFCSRSLLQDHRCFRAQFGVSKSARIGEETCDALQLQLNPDMANLTEEEFKRTEAHRQRQVPCRLPSALSTSRVSCLRRL